MAPARTDMPRTDLVTILEQTALLSSLSRAEFQLLAARTVRKQFAAGELLFSEDEPCHGLHIIARGKVRIFKTSSERPRAGPRHQSGRRVGSRAARSSTAAASPHPPWRLKILRSPSSRATIFTHSAWSIPRSHSKCWPSSVRACAVSSASSKSSPSPPFASASSALLLRLAETEGKQTPHGIEFHLPVSHQELASQLGTVRELVSRNLMRLQAEGLLDVDARQIVVKDKAGLSALLTPAP